MPNQPFRVCCALLAAIPFVAAKADPAHETPYSATTLEWAYPHSAPTPLPEASPGIQRLPGSTRAFTQAELNDHRNPRDWYPEEHPSPPAIVAHAREGVDEPCGECHLFNGAGFLGAPDLAGLPAQYIVRQVVEFRSGRRRSWQPGRPGTQEMIDATKLVTDAELASAAAYYASLPRQSRYRVIETETVPAAQPNYWGWMDLVPEGAAEPIRGRIIEVPEDTRRMFLGDAHVKILIYVPTGAVKRGEAIVGTGGSSGAPCAGCHGADFQGKGEVPPINGRSAAYITRMLWDFKTGARSGSAAVPMQATVAGLTVSDITEIAAFLASKAPTR